MKIQVLIILFGCHWLADYTHLSTAWMLNAKRLGKPLRPIFVHASVHAFLMAFALMVYGANPDRCVQLLLFQLLTHFAIDVWKGRMNGWFPKLQRPISSRYCYYYNGIFLQMKVIRQGK
jgi:hypothetical protein